MVRAIWRANAEAASAFWQLGWLRYRLGDWRESAEASRKTLELDPDLVPVRLNLGLALLRAGERSG